MPPPNRRETNRFALADQAAFARYRTKDAHGTITAEDGRLMTRTLHRNTDDDGLAAV